MKDRIKTAIITMLIWLSNAGICYLAFNFSGLDDLLKKDPTYLNWVGISIISTMLFSNFQEKDDTKGPKIS